MLKTASQLPILRATNDEILPGDHPSKVVLSSARTRWNTLLVEEHHVPSLEWDGGTFVQHVVAVNVGRPLTSEVRKARGFRRIHHKTGSISVFPSHQPFYSRIKKNNNGGAEALFVALDPVFLNRIAAQLEAHLDRVELMEQRGINDPVLMNIAMAIRDGLRAGRASDQMYGEALSTALAVHLLRGFSGTPVTLEPVHGRLSREKLMRALEYIQDQLGANLTVSEIARSVHMSPYHFTRLFKRSTGLSPYRYVIQARVKKAKELLTSGKFSIIEIAHRLSFADQSHLSRHLKRLFGVTPKLVLERRDVECESSKTPHKYPRERTA